jgi:exosortase H (IPTLxxWG-CTERM-specific)|tara:strand:- start:400 stop:945 length:546 start_codon:yes stop_codon:yes gene_type:complete
VSAFGRIRTFWAVPTYRFAMSFLIYLAVIAIAFPVLRNALGELIHASEVATAHIVYYFMALFSSEVRVGPEAIVRYGGFSVTIIEECTGVYEALILSAALLAYPTRWRNTLLGFAIGIPMIYVMNVVRIIALIIVGRYSNRWFDFMHVYFWQVTMIAMIATVWMAWLWWVVRDETDPVPAG